MAESATSEGVTLSDTLTIAHETSGGETMGDPLTIAGNPYPIFDGSDSLVLTVVLEFGAPDVFGLISQCATIKFNTWYMHGNGSCCFLNTFFILS